MSCEAGLLYTQGSVLAVSDQQRERITEILNHNQLSCSAEQGQQVHGGTAHTLILCYALMEVQGIFWSERSNGVFVCAAGSSVGLQVGLVLTALLLFALGAALFVYLYKKR